MKPAREVIERPKTIAQVIGPPPGRKQVPVGEPPTGTAAADDRFEHGMVVLDGHVLEQVAQIESIEGAPGRSFQELFDRLTVPLQSIHAIADRLEMLGAKRNACLVRSRMDAATSIST